MVKTKHSPLEFPRNKWAKFSPSLLTVAITSVWAVNPTLGFAQTSGSNVDSRGKYELPQNPILYLDVKLNGVRRGLLAFEQKDTELWVDAQALRSIGLNFEGKETRYNVYAIAGLSVNFKESEQVLEINVDANRAALPISYYGTNTPEYREAQSSPGGIINYDLYANHDAQQKLTTANVFNEVRVFGSNVVVSNTALTKLSSKDKSKTIRFETKLDLSFQKKMINIRLGDTITPALPWSRSIRMGGIQVGKDFSLNPHWNTSALPDFFGTVTAPSNVDLLINGSKQFSTRVDPGPFAISTLPVINGYGNAELVMTDALGQTRTVEVPIFISNSLLRAQLVDWNFSAGSVRKNYGVTSFDYYKEAVATGKIRYGLSSRVTVESVFELAKKEDNSKLYNAGVGIVTVPFPILGETSLFYRESSYLSRKGRLWGGSYRWGNRYLTIGWSMQRTDKKYDDIASVYGATVPYDTRQLFGGLNIGHVGSLAMNYLSQRSEQSEFKFANVSWFKGITDKMALTINYNKSLTGDRAWGMYVGLTATFDDRVSASLKMTNKGNQRTWVLDAMKPASTDGGFGWRVGGLYNQAQPSWRDTYKQAEVEYLGRYGYIKAGATSNSYSYAELSGAAVVMKRSVFLTREVSDAFAVVSTNGIPNVPVLLDNKPMGKTDKSGLLLVNPLFSYQNNAISIDSLKLPAGYDIGFVNTTAVPTRKAGMLVTFPIKASASALVVLVDESGEKLPVGTLLKYQDREGTVVVGYDGQAYLEGLRNQEKIKASLPDRLGRYSEENTCYITITYDETKMIEIQTLKNTVCKKNSYN